MRHLAIYSEVLRLEDQGSRKSKEDPYRWAAWCNQGSELICYKKGMTQIVEKCQEAGSPYYGFL